MEGDRRRRAQRTRRCNGLCHDRGTRI